MVWFFTKGRQKKGDDLDPARGMIYGAILAAILDLVIIVGIVASCGDL